ncbi:nucleotidyltransferase domain-containing protein [Streptacidiphilus albus]|uniref:nucleotidyltransferase domain-containing protein n=1 Tax=Streptacidiphilus albus TaxID=105425 RepID=UPI00054BD18D|nr:nucleotidyltransferase domain-containing protein [Streptacidiphilus albus]
MNGSAQRRLRIAGQAAIELLAMDKDAEVWLEGALATGLAHAASDIDLRLISSSPQRPGPRSRLVDGVRVDLQVSTPQEIGELRTLLLQFGIRQDDLAMFRRARQRMGDLTCLRTALSFHHGQWVPVVSAAETGTYRAWAVADRAETVASLAEDLIGLSADGLHPSADIVLQRLTLALTSAECAATGHPLLGEKWLPLLTGDPWTVTPAPVDWQDQDWRWFRSLQRRLALALLSCHPLSDSGHESPAPPVEGAAWLPQYYSDGWFLRRADERIPVTDDALNAWINQLQSSSR